MNMENFRVFERAKPVSENSLVDGLLGHLTAERFEAAVDVASSWWCSGCGARAQPRVTQVLFLIAQRREHRVVDDTVGTAAAVPTVHELALRGVERHQIVERVTVVGRSLHTLSVGLRIELLVMLLLH